MIGPELRINAIPHFIIPFRSAWPEVPAQQLW
jgi:hypothetical protein